ncbi:MAG TPA: L-serine ammonia-lyase, iron-sulfur-dependent subunit beta [Candidatus Mediterraneibacter norfolkensis]|nr:L-serine ammonia-lyase, iron-sulfur-dependent subunit beta [Candidatus Mediterraneibacter norfolkensis]
MKIFDILGPIMVGPSSSHTAGAAKIGYITRTLLGEKPVNARIGLCGSFAATGKGHGTDKAVIAGLLGMKPDDMRIPESFAVAEKEKLSFSFESVRLPEAHPNTAVLDVTGDAGREITVQASSLGGGRIMIEKLDGTEVSFMGDCPTLIICNQDSPGVVSEVTSILSGINVNIAALRLHRDKRGGSAVMVIETDQPVGKESISMLEQLEGISRVIYVNGEVE